MTSWWNELTALEQAFYYCAIPSTIILVIQTIAAILGIGHDDFDVDFDGDVNVPDHIDIHGHLVDMGDTSAHAVGVDAVESASSLKFFSIRGIVAFFSLFGWVGVVLANDLNPVLVFFIAALCGLAGMLVIALMFYFVSRLQQSGNINIRNAVGSKGTVYLTIPPKQSGKGKIQVTVQDRYTEVDAVTNSFKPLATGTAIRVVDVIDLNTLLVEKQD